VLGLELALGSTKQIRGTLPEGFRRAYRKLIAK